MKNSIRNNTVQKQTGAAKRNCRSTMGHYLVLAACATAIAALAIIADGCGESGVNSGGVSEHLNMFLDVFCTSCHDPDPYYPLTINIVPPEGGTVSRNPNANSYKAGTQVVLKAEPRPGYTFLGWSGQSNASDAEITILMDGPMELTASFPCIGCNQTVYVIFNDVNDRVTGSGPTAMSVHPGDTIKIPDKGSLRYDADHRFIGWTENSNGTGTCYPPNSDYIVVRTVNLYAKWVPIYTLTYNGNGTTANVPGKVDADSGTVITLADNGKMALDWHNFGGWNTKDDGTGTNYDANSGYTVNDNATLYARWNVLPPNAPTSVIATATSSSSIDLSWPTVSYSTGYKVYRNTSASGNYTYVTSTPSTGYTDTYLSSGTTYYYKVSAYNSAGESDQSYYYASAMPFPDAPSCTATPISSSSITVNWSSVTGTTGYKVYRSTSASGAYSLVTTISSSSTTSFTNTGLSSGTTYYYKVSAYNNGGESALPSSYCYAMTFPDAPNCTVTPTSSSSITVSWSSVTGATGYKIYRGTSAYGTYSLVTTISSSSTTSYTYTGLSSSTTYYYKISAYNDGGESALSSSYCYATTFPNAPIYTVTPISSSSITVSWSSVTGATGYKIYRSTSAYGDYSSIMTIYSSSTTSYTNTGLSSGTTYYYKITAYNDGGESALPSSYYSATTLPDAPVTVIATAASSSSITVSWSSVAGATGYKVYQSLSASGTYSLVTTTTTTSYNHTGLASGTTYYYKISAYNDGGESAQSSYYSATTIPAPPTTVTATAASSSSITVSWSSVSGATGYKVYRSTNASSGYDSVWTTSSTSFTNTGLSAGTAYYYKVSAYNSGGTSALFSSYGYATTLVPIPSAPTSVTATAASSSSIDVSWSSATGATGYKVYRSLSASSGYDSVWTTSYTSFTNTGLSAGTTYYYKVSAYNSGGTSALSSSYGNATTLLNAPTTVTATAASSSSIDVNWSSVTGATGYYVYRSTSASGTYSYVTSTSYTSFTNTGLSSGTTYYYKVSAYNGAVESALSSSYGNATTLLNAPTSVTATAASSSSIDVSWSSVTGATGYYVYRSTSASGTYSYVTSTSYTSFTNTGLSSGTTYYYKVSAYNSTVDGPLSSYTYATPPAISIPSMPTNVYATAASSSSITVSWSSVTGATEYNIYRYNGTSFVYLTTTSSTSYTNTGLSSGTTYYYTVSAYNSAGESSQSSYVYATTTTAASTTVFTETFESGINNWVLVNGSQTNKWMRGTATSYGGSYSVYISNNSSANSYTTTTSSVVHIYKDITFPTSNSDFTLTFYFKGYGEGSSEYNVFFDYMTVRYSTTSYTPAAGSTFSSGTLLGTNYMNYNTSWLQKTITLPAATFSGRTMRLVFSWINDSSVGTQPPAAIDNIIITTP